MQLLIRPIVINCNFGRIFKNSVFSKPTLVWCRLDLPTSLKSTFIAQQFLGVYLHLFSRGCLPKSRNHAKFRQNLTLLQFKGVIDLGVNRKTICDFLLVINSNFGRICYRPFSISRYWLISWKTTDFSHPTLVWRPFSRNPLEFLDETCPSKTRGMGLPYGENFMILPSTLFIWITHVADGQTVGRQHIAPREACHVLKWLVFLPLLVWCPAREEHVKISG